MERCILHCDMNNFFASVECLMDNSLKNVPMAVCGEVEKRHGIVLAKNYKAKAYNIETGETVFSAKQKCPSLVIVSPHYDKYNEISKKARDIYYRYTDMIEPFGLDECWLDVTGSMRLFGSGENIANLIREDIKNELGVTVSVGVSFNKVFAKLGSDMKKPDAVTVISKEHFKEQIWGLPSRYMLGVGSKTYEVLKSMGISTIGDIANMPIEYLRYRLGKGGEELHAFANGLDMSPVTSRVFEEIDKSVGHGTTLERDLKTNEEVKHCIYDLCEEIGHSLHKYNKKACGVAIMIKNDSFRTFTRQMRLDVPTNSNSYIASVAYSLFLKNYTWNNDVRTVTVRAIDLVDGDSPSQLDIFADAGKISKLENIDNAVEKLKDQYGKNIIVRASMLKK